MYYFEAANYNIYIKRRMKINFFVNEIHLSYSVETELEFVVCIYLLLFCPCFINAL
jgi:hypothetical protein